MISKVFEMPFSYQKWKKQESEQKIINALLIQPRTKSALLEMTDLSKPILSERLEDLKRQGKIELVVDEKEKRFLYKLVQEKLSIDEQTRLKISFLTQRIITALYNDSTNASIYDEVYQKNLNEGMQLISTLKFYESYFKPTAERDEYLKTVYGVEFVKQIPLLFPENRKNIMIKTLKELPEEEKPLFLAQDKEMKNAIRAYVDLLLLKISETSKKSKVQKK
jgi:hypothetical protein